MANIDWDLALKVCLYGQTAVFIVLILLMLAVQAASAFIQRFLIAK